MDSILTQQEGDANIAPYSVSKSRSPEQKVSKALVKALNDQDLNMDGLGFFLSYESPAWFQNRFIDLFIQFIRAQCDLYDTGTYDETDKNYNAMIRAVRMRDGLIAAGFWNYE